jgi:hypothetical protein
MSGPIGFLVVFFGVMLLIVVLAVRAYQRSSGASLFDTGGPLKRLGQELGLPEGAPFLVEREGRAFTAKYMPGGKNTPPTLRLTAVVDEVSDAAAASAYRASPRAHVAVRPAIVLRRETGADRFGKRVGLNREVQLGDAGFDAAVYIETDSPEDDVQRTLADEALRGVVRALLDAETTRVELDPAGLSAVSPVRGGAIDVATFESTAAQLAQAAAALPLFDAGRVTKARSQVGVVVTMVVLFLAWPFAMGLMGRGPIDRGATLVGLAGGLALWAVLTFALAMVVRGKSDSLRRLGMLAGPSLLCIPMTTYGAVVWANRELDTSPPVDHPTTVQRMWTSRPKNTTYYHLDVASWRPGEVTQSLNVSPAFYSRSKQGMGIVVTTHAGKLGWEWVDTFRLTPRETTRP